MEDNDKINIKVPSSLPTGWELTTIENISTVIMGQSPPSSTYNDEGKGLPFFQGKTEFGELYPIPVKWCSDPNKRAQKADVLISVRAPVGPTNLAPSECCIGRGLAAIRPAQGIPSKYILYYLRGIESEIDSLGTGTTFKAISGGTLRLLPVALAPQNQRQLIVAEIEKQFSRLDEAVANLKRIKANLKRYKAAVLKAAVEGKLTEEWRKAHPEVEPANELLKRILAERRKKWEEAELAKMRAKGTKPKDNKWERNYEEPTLPLLDKLPSLPVGWVFAGVEQLLQPQREAMKTGPFGSLLKKHEHKTEGVPVLGIENILAMQFIPGCKIHITKQKAKDLDGYTVLPGDILISRSGTVGEVCVVPENIGEARISTNLLKLSLAGKGMLPDFFTFLFNGSPFVLNQVSELCKGSTRIFLNQDILKRLVFVLPPSEEQLAIITEVNRRYSVIENIEKEIVNNMLRADRTRQSILRSAYSGQLTEDVSVTRHDAMSLTEGVT